MDYKLKKTIFFLLLLIISTLFFVSIPVVQAQNQTSEISKKISHNDLEKELENIKLEFQETKRQLEFEIQKQSFEARKEFFEIAKFFWVCIIVFVIIFPTSVGGLIIWAKKKVKEISQNAIYQVDPLRLKIMVPKHDFDKESTRLKRLGFKNIRKYVCLDSHECSEGCVIVKINDNNDISDLDKYLKEVQPDISKVAFILYSSEHHKHKLNETFENITFSNSLTTLGTQVFNSAREIICCNKI